MRALLLAVVAGAAMAAPKAEFKAGVSTIDITPGESIWMSGYGNRTKPSEGVLTKLYAKALAIEDNKGGRAVIVTTDLLGLTRDITEDVAARALKQWNLDRSRLLFNSSHTHTGPLIRARQTMFALSDHDAAVVERYRRKLAEDLLTVIGAALGDLEPAVVSYAQGTAGFAVNRRQFTPQGVRIGIQPDGPKDHSVPVIHVRTANGKQKALLFGYACHNTTLGHYKISGDYAGFAQAEIERRAPGTTALFLLLGGGDQNPNPRGTDELAIQHGTALASAVLDAAKSITPVRGRINAAFQFADLAFAVHTREDYEKEAAGKDVVRQRRAKLMLDGYDAGHPVRTLAYPVQAIRFGRGPALLALGGEVVIDYSIRARKEFPRENLVVIGYSNDVACYIPSKRVLGEGGYEADSSMVYYGQPGPFADDVEERVFTAIRSVMRRAGAKGAK